MRAYLETLSNTGLLQRVLGDQARFYADYLAFLRGGGQIDAFAGLPANIFAGYTVQLDAYFAFLATGRRPSEFSGTVIAALICGRARTASSSGTATRMISQPAASSW